MMQDNKQGEAKHIANAIRRHNLFIFMKHAFVVLHPGAMLLNDNYIETLCFELQEAATSDGGRLIITMPPRYLKSIAASIVLPAWILGRDGASKILVASYADTLATDHARLFRNLVATAFYRSVFPQAGTIPAVNNVTQFQTSAGGGRRAVTVGGSVTGIGGDLIILDDPLKASDAGSDANRETVRRFYDDTLYTRLNDKKTGSVIVVQQRLHQDDLIAHLLEKGTFRHVNFPAIAEKDETYRLYNGFTWTREKGEVLAPSREGIDVLGQIKADMGEVAFRTQYQQDPASAGSTMLDFSKVTVLDGNGSDIRPFKIFQTWDTAVKDGPNCDYSVGITFAWDDERWVLMDVVRRRMKFGDLKAAARQFHKKWKPALVLVEDSGNGSALVNDLRSEKLFEFKTLAVKSSKEERFATAVEWLENGTLVLLRGAAYFEELRRELIGFPEGRHDDQVDAISLFVKRAKSHRPIGESRGHHQRKIG
jgi:predicted phage terminase large subunit-like protein